MTLHLEKKAIRALGVAESFRPKDRVSTLAGVVMRSDLVIDGFALGKLHVSGSDATEGVLDLFYKLERNDINSVLLAGSVLSLYNIVDIEELHEKLKLPIVALSFRKSSSNLASNIRSRFEKSAAEEKIALLKKLGASRTMKLATGYFTFARTAGINSAESKRLLDRFTLQGAIPEPIRVAKLLVRSVDLS